MINHTVDLYYYLYSYILYSIQAVLNLLQYDFSVVLQCNPDPTLVLFKNCFLLLFYVCRDCYNYLTLWSFLLNFNNIIDENFENRFVYYLSLLNSFISLPLQLLFKIIDFNQVTNLLI